MPIQRLGSAMNGLASFLFPSRDETLTRLISALSEPDSGPPADNLVSNEDSYVCGAGDLADTAHAGGVYLGVGPDQNFSMIAASRPDLAFVVDYRRRNLRLLMLHRALMALAKDRRGYLSRLTARPPIGPSGGDATGAEMAEAFGRGSMDRGRLDEEVFEVARYLRPFGLLEPAEWADLATIQAKLAGPGVNARFLGLPGYPTLKRMMGATDHEGRRSHFLESEAAYGFVRDLQIADRLVPIVGDLAGHAAFARLADWLNRHGLEVATVYVSDVEFFLLRAGRFAPYVVNLSALPRRKDARIVRTSTRPLAHPERKPGDRATTIVRDLGEFLNRAGLEEFREPEDLFRR